MTNDLISRSVLRKEIDLCDFETVKDKLTICEQLANAPTVAAVEVEHINTAKKEILDGFDVLIAEYRHISQSSNDHFGIKADAMETARRLVNAALTDLCTNCGAKMDKKEQCGHRAE